MLNGAESIDVTEIVFYAIALPLGLYLTFKHGYSAWFYIVTLGLCRLIGGSTGLASYHTSNLSTAQSLEEASIITGSVGISFITYALLRLVERVNLSLPKNRQISPLLLALITPLIIVAVVMSILGGIDSTSYKDPSKVANGQTYFKVSITLLLVLFVVVLGAFIMTALKKSGLPRAEYILLIFGFACLPSYFVRILYAMIAVWNPTSTKFSLFHPDYVVEGVMSLLMEFIVVIILIVAGFVTPTSAKVRNQRAQEPRPLDQGQFTYKSNV